MTSRRFLTFVLLSGVVALAALAGVTLVRASAPAALSGAAFTYQGRLEMAGKPYTGSCDFQFGLWDAAAAGSQVGSTLDALSVNVSDGLFSVRLDFGAGSFDGNDRYLEVAVRCPAGAGDYTTLAPRRELTAAPYALFAGSAPWDGLADVPPGFADGIDDSAAYTAGQGLTLLGTMFSVDLSAIQARITGACGEGFAVRAVAADGSVTCEQDDGQAYSAGAGLSLIGSEFAVTGAPWEGLWNVPTGFADGEDDGLTIVSWTDVLTRPFGLDDGDNDTTYTAGTGLSLIGTVFNVDTTTIQARVTGVCGASFSISSINDDGTVTCEQDDNTTYIAGSGLDLAGTIFSVTGAPWAGLTGMPAGFVDGVDDGLLSVSWTDILTRPTGLDDGDDNTTYSAGSGLNLAGTVFSVIGAPWAGLTGVPAGFADGADNDTTYSNGSGLGLAGTVFSVLFGGNGSASTAARSDHNHDASYVNEAQADSVTSAMIVNGVVSSNDLADGSTLTEIADDDGAASGLDADLLDGQTGSYYQNATNLNAGTLATGFFSAIADLIAEGYLDNNADGDLLTRLQADGRFVNEGQADSIASAMITDGVVSSGDLQDGAALAEIADDDGAASGLDADLFDGLDSTAFASSSHNHDTAYVNEGQADSVTSAMITNGAVSSSDLQDGATLAEIADDDGAGSGLDADTLDGISSAGFAAAAHAHSGVEYSNVVVVASTGGDYTSIQSALDSITCAGADRYLVYVAPGTYTERVTMKSCADIEGAGVLASRITYTGSPAANTGVVVGASGAEIRNLTIESLGTSTYAIGLYNSSASPRVTDVVINIAVSGLSVTNAYGIHNTTSSPTVMDTTINVSGGSASNTGIYNFVSTVSFSDIAVTIAGVSSRGVWSYDSTLTLRNAYVNGGQTGVYNQSSGVFYNVFIQNSQIIGSTNAILSTAGYTVRVGATMLSGGVVSGGTNTCAGVYDENYTFFASTCP